MIDSTTVSFSALDGGPQDEDGVADGVLTIETLTIEGDGTILIDVPTAHFLVAGDVKLQDNGAIRSPALPSVGPELMIEAGCSIKLKHDAAIEADGNDGGGRILLDASDDIKVQGTRRRRRSR